MKRLLAATIPAAAIGATIASPALAHHPLGGMEMSTFAHGILSGVGHPVLGFDHLFFVALMGLAAMLAGHARSAPLAYLGAMALGVVLTASGLVLPLAEAVIALSLLGLGYAVARGQALGRTAALAIFAGFGLFHGAAFGGAMANAEAGAAGTVLAGYLIGLVAVQYAIALVAGALGRAAWSAQADAVQPRLAGAVVAGIGAFLVLEQAEGAVFAAMGWG